MKAQCFLIFTFMLAFLCLGVSIYIFIHDYAQNGSGMIWPGLSLFIQCLLIFISSLVMRVATKPSDDGGMMMGV